MREFTLSDTQENSAPSDFCCPISLQVMRNPVIAADGHTYERAAIVTWFEQRNPVTSPKTRERLEDLTLRENHQLRSMILDWVDHIKHEERKSFADHINDQKTWFSYPELRALTEKNKQHDSPFQQMYQKVILFLGPSQSGKSTLINYLLGALYENKGILKLKNGTERAAVGNGFDSVTDLPTVYPVESQRAVALADTPGFFDDRGNMQRIMTTLSLEKLVKQMQSCGGLVFVVDYTTLTANKAETFFQLARTCCTLLNLTTQDQSSTLFAFTKVTPNLRSEQLLSQLQQFEASLSAKLAKIEMKSVLTDNDQQQKLDCIAARGLVRYMLTGKQNIVLTDPTNLEARSRLLDKISQLSLMDKKKLTFQRYDDQRIQFDVLMHRLVNERICAFERMNEKKRAQLEAMANINTHRQTIEQLNGAVDIEHQLTANEKLIALCEKEISDLEIKIGNVDRILTASDLDQTVMHDSKTMTRSSNGMAFPESVETLRYNGVPFNHVSLSASVGTTVLENNPSAGRYAVRCYAPTDVHAGAMTATSVGAGAAIGGVLLSIFTLGLAAPIAVAGVVAYGAGIGTAAHNAGESQTCAILRVYVKKRYLPERAAELSRCEASKQLHLQALSEKRALLEQHKTHQRILRTSLSAYPTGENIQQSKTSYQAALRQEVERLNTLGIQLGAEINSLKENIAVHKDFMQVAAFIADHLSPCALQEALLAMLSAYRKHQLAFGDQMHVEIRNGSMFFTNRNTSSTSASLFPSPHSSDGEEGFVVVSSAAAAATTTR